MGIRQGTVCMAVLAMIMLTGCTSTISKVDSNGLTDAPVFPEVKEGKPIPRYMTRDQIDRVDLGMSKQQIMFLIGEPQFSEGMFGVREWDYLLRVAPGKGEEGEICQFKVLFDKDKIARSFYSLPEGCAASKQEEAPKTVTTSLLTDTSFAFGSASMNSCAYSDLERVALRLSDRTIERIEITGHTDRIGNADANDSLSRERAMVIRNYLVNQGVDPSLITADSVGSAQSLIECPGPTSAEVIACLAPNRRTDITAYYH